MIRAVLSLMLICFISTSNASLIGKLFAVDCNWENQRNLITLCLLKETKMDCEDFVVNGREISIHALSPTNSPSIINAAITGVRATPRVGCSMLSNGYCVFSVTHDRLSFIKLL